MVYGVLTERQRNKDRMEKLNKKELAKLEVQINALEKIKRPNSSLDFMRRLEEMKRQKIALEFKLKTPEYLVQEED